MAEFLPISLKNIGEDKNGKSAQRFERVMQVPNPAPNKESGKARLVLNNKPTEDRRSAIDLSEETRACTARVISTSLKSVVKVFISLPPLDKINEVAANETKAKKMENKR